ncbi:LolA family protein [Mesoterricola sediminis]|uniref:Outer membrane lipoprotein carrier protein LolA n=1 Tax=Mesoterricola sediminis TaxID=2927980 RepID=A0AA48GTG7_9BACT|nr:outer-membrane lipoprotein carrier protein LolA [Mesoterricola sediminis]BDU77292.1 hypothetical protein METESE_22500 [Mesoterricola sediminis]
MNAAPMLIALLAAGQAGAQVPAWWKAFTASPRLESRFTQTSESAVFGQLKRTGLLRLARGGKLRVDYHQGLLLVADGTSLVQYDPSTRTAQKVDIQGALKDAPLLAVLLDPAALERVYTVKPGPGADAFSLEPRAKGLPPVALTGRGGLPRSLAWTDPTGARQVLTFEDPRVPGKPFEGSLFTFKAPAGTRWLKP